MGTLYVVGTPIGNLEDITYRAVKILSEVELIAAEDTRRTKILLDRYQIKKPLTSYHKFNLKSKTAYLISQLKEDRKIALVTDSGMPGISDPGYELIRQAIAQGIKVEPIPGTSALLVALSVSGLPTERFVFEGFLPKKKGRKSLLGKLSKEERTIILYESPYRILKTLKEIKAIFGERKVSVGRELTKVFEEFIRGSVSEVIAHFEKVKPKGELTIVIEGSKINR